MQPHQYSNGVLFGYAIKNCQNRFYLFILGHKECLMRHCHIQRLPIEAYLGYASLRHLPCRFIVLSLTPFNETKLAPLLGAVNSNTWVLCRIMGWPEVQVVGNVRSRIFGFYP